MTRPAHRAIFGASAIFASFCAYLGLASCTSSTTTTIYTPFTGLRVDAASVFAGHACGVGPGQIYAYAAVLTDSGTDGGPQPAGWPIFNVYACSDNAAFQNLPGSGYYQVQIYAYDKSALPADLACVANNACSFATNGSDNGVDFGTPTWTATCSGVQEAGDNSLVVCGPLGLAGSSPADGSVPDAEAGGGPEAGPSDGSTGALDAGTLNGDAGASDASAGGGDAGVSDGTAGNADAGAFDTGTTDGPDDAADADGSD